MADISKITHNSTQYNIKDSGAVHQTGSETITGLKTFQNSLKIGNCTLTFDTTTNCLKFTF